MFVTLRKSQVTIPESIVKKLNLHEGSTLKCTETSGKIILTPFMQTDESIKPEEYSRLKIFCFNRLIIMENEKPIPLTNKKAMELMGYLVCQTGACAKKVSAAEALWANSMPEQSANNLYKAVEAIKKLRNHQIFLPFESLRSDFKLLQEYIYCDLWEFELLYHAGGVENWEKAEKIYKGILFVENDFSWALEYEGRYDIMYIEIIEYLYNYYERMGNKKKANYYRIKMSDI